MKFGLAVYIANMVKVVDVTSPYCFHAVTGKTVKYLLTISSPVRALQQPSTDS